MYCMTSLEVNKYYKSTDSDLIFKVLNKEKVLGRYYYRLLFVQGLNKVKAVNCGIEDNIKFVEIEPSLIMKKLYD